VHSPGTGEQSAVTGPTANAETVKELGRNRVNDVN
jgi:hypothetical protein